MSNAEVSSGAGRGGGDSVKQAIIEELQNLLSSDTTVLQQAEKRNKQLQYTEGMHANWRANKGVVYPMLTALNFRVWSLLVRDNNEPIS